MPYIATSLSFSVKKTILLYYFVLQIAAGFIVTICVTTSWVGATHLIKDLFLREVHVPPPPASSNTSDTVKAEELPQVNIHLSIS